MESQLFVLSLGRFLYKRQQNKVASLNSTHLLMFVPLLEEQYDFLISMLWHSSHKIRMHIEDICNNLDY